MTRRRLVLLCGLLYGGAFACADILDLQPPNGDGSVTTSDASEGFDATIACSLDAQAPTPTDAAYNVFRQVPVNDAGGRTFQLFDLGTLPAGTLGDASVYFHGGTFDGTNVYFTPYEGNGWVVRHPVSAAINASWTAFNPGLVADGGQMYEGAAFDGRYVYFAPQQENVTAYALRYDSKASFTATSSWVAFDTSQSSDAGAPVRGFSGAVFDGRYVYYVPYRVDNNNAFSGTVARYDTMPTADGGASDAGSDAGDAATPTNAFDDPGNWMTFDTTTVDSRSYGYQGAVYDGHFVYFIPSRGIIFTAYDTTKPFKAAGSWLTFEIDTLAGTPSNFSGGVFDGHFIYLVPHGSGLTLRFDITKGVNAGAFTEFDISTVVPAIEGGTLNYTGGAFDGRYVYYAPQYGSGGELVRYDTWSPFTAACSWQAFQDSAVNPEVGPLWGAVYDGQYLYYVPSTPAHLMVVRYDTKSPPSMPNLPAFNGSFF